MTLPARFLPLPQAAGRIAGARGAALALVLAGGFLAAAPAAAQIGASAPVGSATPAAGTPVIDPMVARRDLRVPRFPSRDFEAGLFTGVYSTQNFGSSAVVGVRLGYHITEDFFVTGQFGQTRVSDDSFRQVLPGGVLDGGRQTLRYGTVAFGYNVFPGEVFFGRNQARIFQGFVLAGFGTTDFAGQRKQTIDIGMGMRLYPRERWSAQAEVRDHVFALDLLGRRETTHNLEITLGVNFYF